MEPRLWSPGFLRLRQDELAAEESFQSVIEIDLSVCEGEVCLAVAWWRGCPRQYCRLPASQDILAAVLEDLQLQMKSDSFWNHHRLFPQAASQITAVSGPRLFRLDLRSLLGPSLQDRQLRNTISLLHASSFSVGRRYRTRLLTPTVGSALQHHIVPELTSTAHFPNGNP